MWKEIHLVSQEIKSFQILPCLRTECLVWAEHSAEGLEDTREDKGMAPAFKLFHAR